MLQLIAGYRLHSFEDLKISALAVESDPVVAFMYSIHGGNGIVGIQFRAACVSSRQLNVVLINFAFFSTIPSHCAE